MSDNGKIFAPWSAEQVANLADFQARPDFHGYTCLRHSNLLLVPWRGGWICANRDCGYTQNWALASIANRNWNEDKVQ